MVLGVSPPSPDYEALLFFKQWLAERNLGLVPIANASAFDSARLLACSGSVGRRRSRRGDVRLSLRAAPRSGQRVGSGGTVEEGWLLARLDVRLPIEEPYGQEPRVGRVEAIFTAPDAESPLVGFRRPSQYPGVGWKAIVTTTVVARSADQARVRADACRSGSPRLDRPSLGQGRRNIVTRGISLNALVGHHFTIGAVECVARRLAEPCSTLNDSHVQGFSGRSCIERGSRADIVRGGSITTGDQVAVAS